jgi:hypothetical protein
MDSVSTGQKTKRPKLNKPGLYWRGNLIWAKYRAGGIVHRASTGFGAGDIQRARDWLDERRGKAARGEPVSPRADKVTVAELLADVQTDYEMNGRRSATTLGYRLAHLTPAVASTREARHLRPIQSPCAEMLRRPSTGKPPRSGAPTASGSSTRKF